MFVNIAGHLDGKLAALRAHRSQVAMSKLVDLEAVAAQARFRGFQARLRLAEAFEPARMVRELGA